MTGASALLRRAAAIAFLALLVWLLGQLVLLPVASHVARVDEAIEQNREFIDRLSRSIASGEPGDAEIRTLYDEATQSGLFVLAETEPLAAARMQETLSDIVAGYGAALQSVQSLPSKDEEGLTRIGVRVMMRGDYASLLRILYDLETGRPVLFIDNLQIKTDPRRRRDDDPDTAEPVSLIFEVFGYLPPAMEE